MSRARLTHYKVRPDELLDLLDAADAGASMGLVRCPGGRLIRDGYMCSHCGKDPTEIIEKDGKRYRSCGAPAARMVAKRDLTKLFPVHIEG